MKTPLASTAKKSVLTARIRNPLSRGLAMKQRGWIAIETGLVLLVATALIIAAVLFYRDNTRKQSINSNVTDILFIASNANSKYGSTGRYGDVTSELAVKSGVVPGHLRVSGTDTANNKFGGAISLTPTDLSGTNDALDIAWPNVQSAQCSDIVTNAQAEFRQIDVGGATVKDLDGVIDFSALESACDVDGTVDLNFFVGRF